MKAAGALWMLVFLLWLPFEDTQVWMTLTLAAAACLWLALRMLPWAAASTLQAGLMGALVGAAALLFTLGLMAFKGGVHGHGFPDFTARQVWSLWSALPFALGFGLSSGFAIKIGGKANTHTRPINLVDPSQSTGGKGSAKPG